MQGFDNQADNATSGLPQEETVLTPEEIAALQPKRTNVVNPWIHEQTHKEFLQNIVVSTVPTPIPSAQMLGSAHATHPRARRSVVVFIPCLPSFFTKYYNGVAPDLI